MKNTLLQNLKSFLSGMKTELSHLSFGHTPGHHLLIRGINSPCLPFSQREERTRKAFTLVELIVVITILAILGTIAFVSIQNYTVYARDAVRTSDVGSISRAITIKIAQGGYAPKPNNPVTITSSGTTVMFQGEFTQKMGAQYGVNGDLVDPLDGKNYTYSTDANLFKHELAGFLESDELTFDSQTHQTLAFTQKAQALEGRTVFTKGDKLGIIFNSEETPIQELSLSGSTLDILNTTDTYKIYFDNNETLQGTGSTLSVVNPRASCKRILEMGLVRKGDKADGVYKISPAGEEFEVYCDMTTDGGGWTLVGKVNSSNSQNIDEDPKWFIDGQNQSQLLNINDNRNLEPSALGVNNLVSIIDDNLTVSRFTIQAEGDVLQNASFYKQVTRENFLKWFYESEMTNTMTCSNVGLTENCADVKFTDGGVSGYYNLSNMNLTHYGYTGCEIHLRLNDNESSEYSSVCSCTFNNDSNKWNDSSQTHWGNSLLIYIK